MLFFFAAVCEELTAPANADIDCFGGNSVGSVCEFTCNVGYTRVGAALATCTETSEGVAWSDPTPVCERGKFLSFALK